MSVADRREQALQNLEQAFPHGTLGQAQTAFRRAQTLGATEQEIAQAVQEGLSTMHVLRNTPNIVILPA